MNKKIIILHNEVVTGRPDQLDVIKQRDLVMSACLQLGHNPLCMSVGNDLFTDIEKLREEKPDLVFNLVEESWGQGELIYIVPSLLNAFRIPYTGVPLDALFLTTNKVLSKKIMRLNNIPTPPFFSIEEIDKIDSGKHYIVKPIWEEASVGIDQESVFNSTDDKKIDRIKSLSSTHYFIEEFIEGREFNISMLTLGDGMPEVMPPAEMIFSGYFSDKPKIVDYKAKWDEGSPEYQGTNREFDTLAVQPDLMEKLKEICRNSWKIFNLRGYARVDLRIDSGGNPFVLEINGNPCISPDSGFVAAAQRAGYIEKDMISRVLLDLN
jgi:D-alanine-D-alanine ligase